jgi:DNA invertase Pin-like site-specific DNA recombinase
MIYGYARVRTRDQSTDMQVSRLLEAGIPKERIFMDVISGATEGRLQLNSLLSLLNKGGCSDCLEGGQAWKTNNPSCTISGRV